MEAPAATDDPCEGIGFNMTPMIDVVFQLIIFLMLANDMSRRDIEDLLLPRAPHGSEDGATEKHRVIVNLLRGASPGAPPELKVRGRVMSLDEFAQSLGPDAAAFRDPADPRYSEMTVLLRADRENRWEDVQRVLQACAERNVGIHRIQFATEDPARGGKEE